MSSRNPYEDPRLLRGDNPMRVAIGFGLFAIGVAVGVGLPRASDLTIQPQKPIVGEPTPRPLDFPTLVPTRFPAVTPTPTVTAVSRVSATAEAVRPVAETPLFVDKDANEAARKRGIHAGVFFRVPESVVVQLSAFKDQQLHAIFPPAVMARKQLIYDLSIEFGVPPNVIAALITIESFGFQEAGSSAAAIGLFQPLDDKFPQALQFIYDSEGKIKDPEAARKLKAKQEPYTNGRAGLSYFVNSCLPRARQEIERQRKEGGNPVEAMLYVLAFSGYNAGCGVIGRPYEKLPVETRVYIDEMIRYLVNAEIAGDLRKMGKSDGEIVLALRSPEVDARSSAFYEYLERIKLENYRRNPKDGRYFTFLEYQAAINELQVADLLRPPSGSRTAIGRELFDDYLQYVNGQTESYQLPISAAGRIHLAVGGKEGKTLFDADPRNNNYNDWLRVDTRRN